jgi:multidrug efflux pump subunit AcrA (membrane-fusion protein)
MLLRKLRHASITLFGIAALGLGAIAIARQSERPQGAAPSRTTDTSQRAVLSLAGETSAMYVTKVYSLVDCRIDRVMVELGSRVKKGDPLFVLVSPKLAEEKNRYIEARSQWRRASEAFDRKLSSIDRSKPLTQQFLEAKDWVAKLKSEKFHLELALSEYGLTDDDIAKVSKENDSQKARVVLRAPKDGVVFKRDAVPGNFYDSFETLLVIARDDELTVTGILDPRDAGKVRVGQQATVHFSDGDRTLESRVTAIKPNPDSNKLILETSISNLDHSLKAGLSARITVALGLELQSEHRNPVPAKQKTDSTLEERLSEVERKLDNFLQDSEKPSSSAEILKRLSDVERKLDRLLEPRSPK